MYFVSLGQRIGRRPKCSYSLDPGLS